MTYNEVKYSTLGTDYGTNKGEWAKITIGKRDTHKLYKKECKPMGKFV